MRAGQLAVPVLARLLAGATPEPLPAQDPAVSHDAVRRVDQLMANYAPTRSIA